MADRYAYLPTIGLFLMLVWGGSEWAEERPLNLRMVAPLTIAVLIALGVLTFRQIGYWRSNYDLWAHTLKVTRDNFIADEKMGDFLLTQGRPEALDYYEAAATIEPLNPAIHGKIAGQLQDHGDFQGAIREYNSVLRSTSDAALRAYTYATLGVIYRELRDYPRARETSERALRLDSDAVYKTIRQISQAVTARPDAPGYFQLGLLSEGAEQLAEARSAYKQALQINPEFGPARKALETLGAGGQ